MNDFNENLEENLEDDAEEDLEEKSEDGLEGETTDDGEGEPEDEPTDELEGELEEEPTDEPEGELEEEPTDVIEGEPEDELEEGSEEQQGEISEDDLIEAAPEGSEGEIDEEQGEGPIGELGEEGEGGLEGLEDEESDEEKAARIERQHRDFQKNVIEASLYAAGKPMSIEILSTKLEIPKKRVEELLNELAFDYLDRSTALVIAQMGDRYQMQIKPEYTEKVSKFAQGGAIAEKYLRTLTIIALKQPIMKSMVVKLRGSGAYEHVKYLTDEGLVEGKKKGRSFELMTTDKYAEMFGLPKDREEMKRMMISQLGLGDDKQ